MISQLCEVRAQVQPVVYSFTLRSCHGAPVIFDWNLCI